MAWLKRSVMVVGLLATIVEGGIIRTLISKATTFFKGMTTGSGCDEACIQAAYSRADVFLTKLDADGDRHLSQGEYHELLAKLFLVGDASVVKEEYEKMCSLQKVDSAVGVPIEKLRFVFQHKQWRDKLNAVGLDL
mmetsp:Transcript_32453/g.75406  ORF Transcript_32453/g.75406 Transcript_32453/m.75406 type:complete len:136 (-) Transcript_32453:103-510(-)|eukprot:CAMPEP_0171089660 /NCGR_PEP_ID=MMETSP0766_2-20121228/27268_1 /TAXON_ID=439317 /ORGANISM="Gambierdiscus australes, Strain CAWD 149" /LENGTH=135 /DNA_ID=CAMNT_0011547561 /DNA_START=35 /DNA_END=442 /DNA_ORIENTATION=-